MFNMIEQYQCLSGGRSKLASVRLHNYWNKVCEDEKRSRLRNEQLLHEFDNLQTKAREIQKRIAELSAVKVCIDPSLSLSCIICL